MKGYWWGRGEYGNVQKIFLAGFWVMVIGDEFQEVRGEELKRKFQGTLVGFWDIWGVLRTGFFIFECVVFVGVVGCVQVFV